MNKDKFIDEACEKESLKEIYWIYRKYKAYKEGYEMAYKEAYKMAYKEECKKNKIEVNKIVAKNLLKENVDISFIQRVTDLTKKQIEKLKLELQKE